MKLEVQEDVLKVRAGRTSNEPADADADGNADEDDAERSSLWIGIAHLLTPEQASTRSGLAEYHDEPEERFSGAGKGKGKGKAGSLSRSRTWLGGYFLCLISPDKKGHVESNEAWKVSPRSSVRGHAAQLRRF